MKARLLSGLLVLGLAFGFSSASANEHMMDPVLLPPALAQEAAGWRKMGSGSLRWLGFSVYQASLWAPEGVLPSADATFALAIRYERSITSQRLVDTTLDEMHRLGTASASSRSAWRDSLAQAFPDVAPGEIIVGLNRPGEGVAFFHQGRLTAQIEDVGFAQAFFAIWLDERTREPGLRARLMGEAETPRTDG